MKISICVDELYPFYKMITTDIDDKDEVFEISKIEYKFVVEAATNFRKAQTILAKIQQNGKEGI